MPDLISLFDQRPVTMVILVLIVATSLFAFRSQGLYYRLILHPYGIVKRREYIRVLSSGLVHNDLPHLVVNSVLLVFLCGELEVYLNGHSRYGELFFGCIFLASQLSGALVVTWVNRNKGAYTSAGASGSILGCMMGFMIIAPDHIGLYLPVIGAVKNLYTALILICGLIVYQWRSGNELLDNELHFYSALGGIGAAMAIQSQLL